MALQTTPSGKIDRQTTTPFHLKLFYRTGAFHRLDEFPTTPSSALPSHLQIYTWPTCTLRELSHLLTTALPSLLPSPAIGTRLSYRLIFPDTRDASYSRPTTALAPRYLSKELGSVVVGDGAGQLPSSEEEAGYVAGGVMAGRLEGEPQKTLAEARFVIGDWVDCAVFAPGPDGAVAPATTGGYGGRGRGGDLRSGMGLGVGGPRENGFGARVRGGFGVGGQGRLGDGGVPSGEWRRGERVPDGVGGGGRSYGRGRGRGF